MKRDPLKTGSTIEVNGTLYQITNYINKGGSALIYEVISLGNNRVRKTVLKEFYPQYSHREYSGIFPDRGIPQKTFELYRNRFLEEGKNSGKQMIKW